MVRVITVHNFLGQHITQIEESTASCVACTAGHEMLLLALPTHCIEVWELTTSDIKLHTVFPTVDTVEQIIHCTKGDYVATLESKCPRDVVSNSQGNKTSGNFVRIYVNWALAKNQNQPMRARIAGRVTPSLNRPLNSLEMIELPLTVPPTLIACCQSTGNLLVAMGSTAILHEFKVETQQLSKLKFIDFEARPWSLGFSFSPTHMEVVEDFVLIKDSLNLHVFRLTNSMYEDIDQLSSLTSERSLSANTNKTLSLHTDDNTISNSQQQDISQLQTKEIFEIQGSITPTHSDLTSRSVKSREKRQKKANTATSNRSAKAYAKNDDNCIDWDKLVYNEKEELERLISNGIVNRDSRPFTVVLPSISIERACPGHTLSPFVLNSASMRVIIKTNSPDLGWSENYSVTDLLRLQVPAESDNSKTDGYKELFSCALLKPLYIKSESNPPCSKKSILRSNQYNHLQGVSCFVCTLQEGYFYHFCSARTDSVDAVCLTTYPFTAPVNYVALEHTAVHALTEVGLESYTFRLSHHVMRRFAGSDTTRNACPKISEPVCLIGLRPFLGVEKLLYARNYLVLLAKAGNSWTLYSLILPKFDNVYFDILTAAKSYKSTSPSTYRHLLTEAHALLRLAKEIIVPDTHNDNDDSYETAKKEEHKLINLYNQSCALLADYYISSECESDWELCIPYYRMSGLKPGEILSRKSSKNAPGLVTFLTDTLISMRNGTEADAFFQGQNIVEMLSELQKKHLLKLIFGSPVLREYTTEKLISRLSSFEEDDEIRLALALLYIQADREDLAEKALEPVPVQCVKQTVLKYWNLLLDMTAMGKRCPMIPAFSDFAGILMRRKSNVFADILVQLAKDGSALSLDQIIHIFLEYLPSRVGRDGHDAAATLQSFLEKYLQDYLIYNSVRNSAGAQRSANHCAVTEAYKLLVRSYLGKLSQRNSYRATRKESDESNERSESFRFVKFRSPYLNRMPPYFKDYQKLLSANDLKDFSSTDNLLNSSSNKDIPKELLKLQSLLSYEFLPSECLYEVKQFLETQTVEGGLSLRTLCIKDTKEVTKILIENCPQAVLQYGKDKYSTESEWKYFVETLQKKISDTTAKSELSCLYNQIMKESLDYLPGKLSLDSLRGILPKDDNNDISQKYIEMWNRAKNADYVESLIMETGQQLLSTLKL